MPYAQTSYQEKVGNSNLTIAEIGCFVTADSNLLEKIGIEEAPDALNAFYEQHNLYSYDLTDHANDDITWSTVTKFHPQLVVKQIGTSGFPDSDLAQVEFRYKDHLGQIVTHFCCVNHAADHSIIDSWDGKVKTPAEYESYYGQPIAWATFENHVPQVETPAPAAPVSAPIAQSKPNEPASAPAPSAPKQIFLPPSVWIWHIYKPGGPYTLPYAIGALDPKQFGGLTYDILGNPAPNIYLIQTKDFGEVAIYAGPDTVAQFPGTGHGEGESLPVADVVPAPAPATPQVEPEPGIVYARFPEPMHLITKAGAQRINFVSGNIVDDLPEGTPFEAVGKATLPNKDVYYMNDNDFGIADETQRTPITVGVKTVYLGPAPAPQAEVITASTPLDASATGTPTPSTTETPESVAPADEAETVPVTIKASEVISDPSLPWQRSMKFFMNPVPYVAIKDTSLFEFPSGNIVKNVKRAATGEMAGRFLFAGAYYYRTQDSVNEGTWKGYPVTALERQNPKNTPFETNDDINKIGNEFVQLSKPKHAAIKAGASAQGLLARFRKTTKE